MQIRLRSVSGASDGISTRNLFSLVLGSCRYRLFAGCQRFQQCSNLVQYFFWLRCLQRKTENALGRELSPSLCILRYERHKPPRIDACLAVEADMELIALAVHLRHSDPLAE